MALPAKQPLIVHIIDHLGLGGQQTFLRAILPAVAAHGTQHTVINLRHATHLSQKLEAQGITVHSLGLPRWSPLQLVAIYKLLVQIQPGIVHTYLTVGNLIGRIAAICAGIPAIVMEDQCSVSQDVYSLPPLVVLAARLAEPLLARHTTYYLGPSEQVQRQSAAAKRWPLERCRVLPNAVDCTRFSPAIDRAALRRELGLAERPTITTLGRFVAQKRLDLVLEVAKQVRAAGIEAQFLIAGSGPLDASLRQAISAAQLEQHVLLLGQRQDTHQLLAASDIYLSASAGEVLSVAILEAMASGCAIVATRAGGTAEQVHDGVNGILRDVADADGLSRAVIGLLQQPTLAHTMGQAGRQLVEQRFSVPTVAAQLAAIYAASWQPDPNPTRLD